MATPPQSELRRLVGPPLIGLILDWALTGVLTNQAYLYHVYFAHDRPWLQCLVYVTVVFEWVQTGLLTENAFFSYVENYGNYADLVPNRNAWFSAAIMCAIVSLAVQAFYAWRIFLLGRSCFLVIVVGVLSLMQAGAGIAFGIMLKHSNATITESVDFKPALVTWLVGSAAADVTIAVSMTALMLRRKTGFGTPTDRTVDKLIQLTVETGTITATVAVLELALCLALPNQDYYVVPAQVLSKLYANALLTTLNNRALLKHKDYRSTSTRPSGRRHLSHELDFHHQPDESQSTDLADRFTSIIHLVDLDLRGKWSKDDEGQRTTAP
ncbi:hypothetical protein DAEQUDRAFT_724981 [Daedalea quercina L-15889]|uniref:DUF6534 domain-containing protein n=1 Tax=Daedalea quercina L-15889 TaxID=1314783 RepID=A0A165RJI4_9APHY|nr:hypothetical protein DAEQUDRAFT_724981 [Daedalea quercina L-15889]